MESTSHGDQYHGLLSETMLVLQQVTSFASDNFQITDPHGQTVGIIHTRGGALSRMLMGSRDLLVTEAAGQPIFRIAAPVNFGFDSFEVIAAGTELKIAHLKSKLSFLRQELSITIAGLPDFATVGDIWSSSLYNHQPRRRDCPH